MHSTANLALILVTEYEQNQNRKPVTQLNSSGVDIISIDKNNIERYIEVKGVGNNSTVEFSHYNYKQLTEYGNNFFLYVIKIKNQKKEESIKLYILGKTEIEQLIVNENLKVFSTVLNSNLKNIVVNCSIKIKTIENKKELLKHKWSIDT